MARYDLALAKRLVSEKEHIPTRRVDRELQNHGYESDETIEAVFAAISENDYYKTVQLMNHPEHIDADVYKTAVGEVEWYVKFFIDGTGELHVQVRSLKWW